MIPVGLVHWVDVANRYSVATLWLWQDFRSFVLQLSPAKIDEFANFYRDAVQHGDITKLNSWFEEIKGRIPSDPDERIVRNLLHVFSHLGIVGYDPFNEYKFDNIAEPALDWSKLPAELSFLSHFAERYQHCIFDDDQYRFAADVTPEQRREFEELDLQCLKIGYAKIMEWSMTMGAGEHKEAALVANLMRLITRMFPDKFE